MPPSTLCTQCEKLPASPGLAVCQSCYASSKPLCQHCNNRPTNPGYSLCQPCFAASNPNASSKLKNNRPLGKSDGASKRSTQKQKRPPTAQPCEKQMPHQQASGIMWHQEQAWQAGPWLVANAYHSAFGIPMQVYPPYVPHPMLQLALPQSVVSVVPVQARALSPLSPAYVPRSLSPDSDCSAGLSPCFSSTSSQEEPQQHGSALRNRRPSTPCGGCRRAESEPGNEYCADCLATGGPDSDDLEMDELISSMFPTLETREPAIKVPSARYAATQAEPIRFQPAGVSMAAPGMGPVGPAGPMMYPIRVPWM